MKLTAGKLRLAGWLIIADIVAYVLVIVVGGIIEISAMKHGSTAGANMFTDLASVSMIFGTAFYWFTLIYGLLVFKELLSGWFKYGKANNLIYTIIAIGIITALASMVNARLGVAPSSWYENIFWVIYSLLFMMLYVLVLKMPGDLFGYRKKIGISGFVFTLSGAIFALTIYLRSTYAMQGFVLNIVLGISLVVSFGFTIYYIAVLIKMLFTAARAVEQGREAKATA